MIIPSQRHQLETPRFSSLPENEPPQDDDGYNPWIDAACLGVGTIGGAAAGLYGGMHIGMARAIAAGGGSQLGEVVSILTLGIPMAMYYGIAGTAIGGVAGAGLGYLAATKIQPEA